MALLQNNFPENSRSSYRKLKPATKRNPVQNSQITGDDAHEDENLISLKPLNQSTVLNGLKRRYDSDVIYTRAGITLIAVNPFKVVDQLYDQKAIFHYRDNCRSNDASKPPLPPHVFEIAEKAYSKMTKGFEEANNQSIIVSGESGAGKTWTTRCLMRYLTLTTTSKNNSNCSTGENRVNQIEKRILDSNPILEAFGNATTARNDNSSRFGKYIQLNFTRSGEICGASINVYLLEKTRVVHQAPKEKNFHIFYQMMESQKYDVPQKSGYLNLHSDQRSGSGSSESLAHTLQAMECLGMDSGQQDNIFILLSAILYLGNINFESEEDGVEPCDPTVASDLAIACASRLLELEPEALVKSLTFRQITASHGQRRKSIFLKPCSVQQSNSRRDSLAKILYQRTFWWLVRFINDRISGGLGGSHPSSFIGLLDIYGFESFEHNSLEQLCINYANEKLQQNFVAHFLRAEQEEYVKEEIEWKFCQYVDNQPCLDLLEGKTDSVFSLLTEECRLNRGSDGLSLNARFHNSIKSGHLFRPKPVSVETSYFIVSHYAGRVIYCCDGLIEKNRDQVPGELVELLNQSGSEFIKQVMVDSSANAESKVVMSKKKSTLKTVVDKFKNSLDSLMVNLKSTSPHYIRCIKPNTRRAPSLFNSQLVEEQLLACGVVETIEISASGYPIRMSYREFVKKYWMMGPGQPAHKQKLPANSREATRLILRELVAGLQKEDKENCLGQAKGEVLTKSGKTKIFLKDEMFTVLEERRLRVLLHHVTMIQRWWRALTAGNRCRAAVVIQAGYQGWRVRRNLRLKHHAARIIQRALLQFVLAKRVRMEPNSFTVSDQSSFTSFISVDSFNGTYQNCSDSTNTEISLADSVNGKTKSRLPPPPSMTPTSKISSFFYLTIFHSIILLAGLAYFKYH